jgi:NAD(P) transhydrogenase subunit alpha
VKLAIPKETATGETRVAGIPETVKKYVKMGFAVVVEKGAGVAASISDQAFTDAGATIESDRSKLLSESDIVVAVNRLDDAELKKLKEGGHFIALINGGDHTAAVKILQERKINALAMELVPRITRAQKCDALSSQATVAGYKAVLEAASTAPRMFPMLTTTAGTIKPAKAFVIGCGVAGLFAVGQLKRMGARVEATDVRPQAKEQAESLGAKFVFIEFSPDRLKELSGLYAKPLTEDEQKRQNELVASHIAKSDVVITTALIPGRPAPRTITKEMVASMAAGSVIVDLAAERGGNTEGCKPGETIVTDNGVTIIGKKNLAVTVPMDASAMYARNVWALIDDVFHKTAGAETYSLNLTNDIVIGTEYDGRHYPGCLLTQAGEIKHENTKKAMEATTA